MWYHFYYCELSLNLFKSTILQKTALVTSTLLNFFHTQPLIHKFYSQVLFTTFQTLMTTMKFKFIEIKSQVRKKTTFSISLNID
jgi:hypothetical protein